MSVSNVTQWPKEETARCPGQVAEGVSRGHGCKQLPKVMCGLVRPTCRWKKKKEKKFKFQTLNPVVHANLFRLDDPEWQHHACLSCVHWHGTIVKKHLQPTYFITHFVRRVYWFKNLSILVYFPMFLLIFLPIFRTSYCTCLATYLSSYLLPVACYIGHTVKKWWVSDVCYLHTYRNTHYWRFWRETKK